MVSCKLRNFGSSLIWRTASLPSWAGKRASEACARSRALRRATRRAHGHSRRWQRFRGSRSHGCGAGHHGRLHVRGKKAYLQHETQLSAAIADSRSCERS